jgi:predicted dehydrogenase
MLDLLRWLLGNVKHVHAEMVEAAPQGKFLLIVQAKHYNGSIAIVRLGNITGQFDIRLDLFTLEAHQFCVPHLGEVTQSLREGRNAGDVLYRTTNLDNGLGRAGYGTELRYFAQNYRQSDATAPSLVDALKASQLCDMILQDLHGRDLPAPEMLTCPL